MAARRNMQEAAKYLCVSEQVLVQEPAIANGFVPAVVKAYLGEPTVSSEVDILKHQFAKDMEEVAPDLQSHGLAVRYAKSLFGKLVADGASTSEQITAAGSQEFYHVGKNVLGPLAVSFVDVALKTCHGKAIFPARDATPFFYIAKTLKTLNPNAYPVAIDDIQNPVFNRKLWGIEDEQDPESETLPVTYPLVQKLLSQMGFFSDQPKSFIEVGCWGSMVDQLYQAMATGCMPKEQFSMHFLYSHLPNHIYGFTNSHGKPIPESVLETIADTWEAFPKFFKRPTKLVEEEGIVKASLDGKVVNSPFLRPWSLAALQGVVDAASEFVTQGKGIDPQDELLKLWTLSLKAKSGEFTGVLPGHTETWSEGEAWKANWKWGKIPPLK